MAVSPTEQCKSAKAIITRKLTPQLTLQCSYETDSGVLSPAPRCQKYFLDLQNPDGTFECAFSQTTKLCASEHGRQFEKQDNAVCFLGRTGRGVNIRCLFYLMFKCSPISDLGHSRSVLPVYSGAHSQRDRWRHRCLLVLRRAEIALHCGWQHDCALPEDEVVSRTFALRPWQNPRIFFHWTILGEAVFEKFQN